MTMKKLLIALALTVGLFSSGYAQECPEGQKNLDQLLELTTKLKADSVKIMEGSDFNALRREIASRLGVDILPENADHAVLAFHVSDGMVALLLGEKGCFFTHLILNLEGAKSVLEAIENSKI